MSKTVVILPSKEAILKAMEVSKTSIDAANYLAAEYAKRLVAAGMREEGAELNQIVQSFAMNVRFALERAGSAAWFGREGETTDYQNMHANIAASALDTLKTTYTKDEPEIVLHCAIGEGGEYVRGFGHDGMAAVDSETVDALDKLFNAWLAKNNIISRDGHLYHSDERGNVLNDNATHPVKVVPDEFHQLMTDPHKGYEAYLSSKDVRIKIAMHDFPSPAPAPAAAAASAAHG